MPSRLKSSLSRIASFTLLFGALTSPAVMRSQAADAAPAPSSSVNAPVVADRLTSPIVESARVKLGGTVHPLANQANDRGAVSDGLKLERLQVVLKRSDAQEASLKQLIAGLHSAGSASYHKWLTPDQFGAQFGPSDADLAKLQSWLQSKGFSVTKVAPGRQVLEISGTAGQLRSTFHTQMHQYSAQGGLHYANATAPDIPAALAPVFGGFVSLNNFRFQSHAKVLGKAQFNATTHESKPDWTIAYPNGTNLVFAPGDFAVQYDLNPAYAAGTKGTGQTIAIVNDSNINVALANNYRTLFSLPANPPQVIIDGNDPGVDGINNPDGPNYDSGEAYLDVELSGAVAPAAQIDLVIAADTAVDSGLTLAMEHAVYANVAPVVSLSFGGCEAAQGGFNAVISALWEEAAAQGQTVLVSTGDSGSAGCDGGTDYAVYGQAVNGLASTPYNVAVGGTDFYYSGGISGFSTYWNLTPTNSTPTVSLLSPIPEQPWNDSQYGLDVFDFYTQNGDESTIAAGGGGASTVGVDNSQGVPTSPYPKPSWQTGTGVPTDGARDLPDLSLFAANGLNNSYYPTCAGDGDCEPVSAGQIVQITGIGGTSASTPSFAGIMALINQKYGPQGQANYVLYPLAAQFSAAFHDVTVGTNAVPCAPTDVFDSYNNDAEIAPKDCMTVSGGLADTDAEFGAITEGELSVNLTNPSYNATVGYDLASGLGSVDANVLINDWNKITLASTATTLNASATTFAHGTPVTLSGTVTGSPTPTGDVSLLTTSTVPLDPSAQAGTYFTLSSGAYTSSVNYLPGGTYNISTSYPGNGVDGQSTSSPVAITVTPENSTLALQVYSALATQTAAATTIASGATVSYGQPVAVGATPLTSSNGTPTTSPTGSVTFLDGSTTLSTSPLNAGGDASYNGAFALGPHSVTAKYSGDNSYGASTSAATTFTVAQDTPVIVQPFAANSDNNGNPVNGQVTNLVVQVENSVSTSGAALPPTGTLSVSGLPSGSSTSATLVTSVDPVTNSPQGTASFTVPASASGNYTVTITYSGDSNYKSTSGQGTITFDTGVGTVATTTTATTSANLTSPTSAIAVAVNVTSSGNTAPTGVVVLYSSQVQVGIGALSSTSGNSASTTVYLNSQGLFPGTNQISVQYYPSNGSSFSGSSTVISIVNPLSDFSIVPTASSISVPGTGSSAGIQTDVLNLSSTNGFSGAVSLSCSAATGVTCSLSPTSATLAAGGQAATTLTVNTTGVAKAGSYSVVVTGANAAGTVVHTVGLSVVTPEISTTPSFALSGTPVSITAPGSSGTSTITATPANSFTGNIALTCAVTASPAGATGTPTCSLSPATASITGATAATSTLTVNTTSTTTAGSYTVTVTGTSGSLTVTTPVAVTVAPVAPPASFTLSGTAVTITAPGSSSTSTITVTPAGGFTGTVALTCAVASAPSGASTAGNPTCSAASASITGTSAATATLTISTTTQTSKLDMPFKRGLFTAGGGVALGALLFFGVPFGRRRRQHLKAMRALRILSVAAFLALIAGAATGCGGGSSSPGPTGGNTLAVYTLTVTGTTGSTTASTTITVDVD